jgi:PAS domain S-box-containing protein
MFFLTSGLNAADNNIKHLLIIHSYNKGLKWTDSEDEGIRSVFRNDIFDVEIHTEYMGTKLISDKKYFSNLADLFKQKYSAVKLSAVIATDDDAFNFCIQNYKTLFDKTPIVFCGVNYLIDLKKTGFDSSVTGVIESFDISGTLHTALKLHPSTKRIVIINDRSTTGVANKKVIERIIPEFASSVSFVFFEDFTMDELLAHVKSLLPDDIILLMTFNRDKAGRVFSYDQSISLIAKEASVPIYGVWDFYLGMGIMGGMLTSGFDQGRIAGEMTLRLLNGEDVNSVPVMRISPNRYKFDYTYLARYNVNTSDLPAKSQVINQPPSFYETNKNLLWGMIAGFTILSIIIFLLMIIIRQQKRGAEALRESEERFRSLVDNLNVGVYRCTSGARGEFLQANPAMLKFFDYESMGEFLRIPVSDLYQYPESRQLFVDELTRNGAVRDKEIPMRKKDDSPIWVSVNARGIFDEKGELKWMDCVLEDITERKKLEEQLRQSQKMEAVGTLAGGVAHDFNNILTAIVGFGGLLRSKLSGDKQLCSYADGILSAAEQATGVTRSLLAFSRKQLLSFNIIDLNDIIHNIEKLLVRIIREDIDFRINLFPQPLPVFADNTQLEQVIVNLAANARDAMPDGGVLTIGTERLDLHEKIFSPVLLEAGAYAILSVTDTGVGISSDVKERIFEPFFTTKEMGKGTGLGLSIVYGIVKQHNGEITVYSEKMEGTTVKIFLRIADLPGEIVKHETVSDAGGGTETILVAEDDPAVRIILKSILEQYGYTVIESVDGADAVEKFAENADRVDMIILDVVMPKLNGKEAYKIMSEKKPGIPVLFSSGYTAEIIHNKGIVEKDLNFISKPFSAQILLAKIRDVLTLKK